MDASNVQHLLTKLGCSHFKQGNNGWFNATCPFAKWKHPSGQDSQPSFGISICDGGVSHFRCHSCNCRGELNYLVWHLARLTGKDLSELMSFVHKNNVASVRQLAERSDKPAGYWNSKSDKSMAGIAVSPARAIAAPVQLELPVLPESDLEPFRTIPQLCWDYLLGSTRRLTTDVVEKWELGYHTAAQRITIPIRDRQKSLVGISGRASHSDQKPKYMHSSGFRRDYYLFGEDKIQTGITGFLVEGFFDVLYLQMKGYNAVAMLGSHLSAFQVQKLIKLFDRVIIVPDGDAPGAAAAKKAEEALLPLIHVTVAKMLDGKDPDELSDELLLECLGPPNLF